MAYSKIIFLDINIVLDMLNPQRVNNKQAIKLWNMLIVNKYTIMISEDMLSTIFYINKDKKHTLEFFQLIQNRWQIVPFGKAVLKNAIDLSLEKTLDLEDLLQCLCAKENGCEVLITNDKKFYNCGVSVCTTEEFLKEENVSK